MNYQQFLESKRHSTIDSGFEPINIPDQQACKNLATLGDEKIEALDMFGPVVNP